MTAVQLAYSSTAVQTSLAAGLSSVPSGSTGQSIQVNSVTGFPTIYPFTLLLEWGTANQEVVTVTQAPTGGGPFTFANCIRGDDGTQAPAHAAGATVNHGVSARDYYSRRAVKNVCAYPYLADNTGGNDPSTAFQNAVADLSAAGGGTLYGPPGTYNFLAGKIPAATGVKIIFDGFDSTTFNFTGSGTTPYLFNMDPPGYSGTVHVEDFELHGVTINATGGDIFWGSNCVRCKITGNYLHPQSNGFAIWNVQNGTGTNNVGYMAENVFNNKEEIGGTARTIEAWHLDFSYTGSLAANDNKWIGHGSKIWPSVQGQTSAFWLKLIGSGTGTTGSRNNRFQDLLFECSGSPSAASGGFIHLQNTTGCIIEGISSEDLTGGTVGTNPMILLDGVGAGDGCSGITIRNYSRRGGPATGTVIDIQLNANCTQIEINSPSLYSGGQPLYVDLQGATNVALTGSWPTGFYTLLNAQGQNLPVNPLIDPVVSPSGATAQTCPLWAVTASVTPASGTIILTAIELLNGTPINNISFFQSATVEAGGTHGWYVLTDLNRVVKAVSADQTGATFWGTANTPVSLSVAGSAYTATYTGKFYIGLCIVATTMPNFATSASILANFLPGIGGQLCGTSNTGQTTPPALGTTLNAISSIAADHLYGYTS